MKMFFKIISIVEVLLLLLLSDAFAQTIVIAEDFESGPYELTSGGTPGWNINTRLQKSGNCSDSSQVATSATSYLTSNIFSTTGNPFVKLEFNQICKIEIIDAAKIEYSLDGGTTWTLVTASNYLGSGSFSGNKFSELSYPYLWKAGTGMAVPQNDWWTYELFDLSSLVGNQPSVMLRFTLTDMNANGANLRAGWFLDDIKISMASSEIIPPKITLMPVSWQDTTTFYGPFPLKALITDPSGIDTAYTIYSVNGGVPDTLGMSLLSNDTFYVEIPVQMFYSTVEYRIEAVDNAPFANLSTDSVRSVFIKPGNITVSIGNGTIHYGDIPLDGYYNYEWSAMVYSSEEIGHSGFIDSISFFTYSSYGDTYQVNNPLSQFQKLRMLVVPDSVFYSGLMPDTTQMSEFFSGDIIWTAPGWFTIVADTPFYYPGTGHLLLYWTSRTNYAFSDVNFRVHTVSNNFKAKNKKSSLYAEVFPVSNGNLTNNRADIKLTFQANDLANNAAVYEMSEPVTDPAPVIDSAYPVVVKIRNLGYNVLSNATIEWSVNGVLQTPYNWTGTLYENQTSPDINIATFTFTKIGYNTIKVWTTNPNGTTDEYTGNDTVEKIIYLCDSVFAGEYSVDPAAPTNGKNFRYFSDMIAGLNKCSITDTTVFNIAPGTYDTSLVFTPVAGAGPNAAVIIQSSTGNKNDVILMHAADTLSDNYVILMSGTAFFNLKDLTLKALSDEYGVCLMLDSGANNNLFEDNKLIGRETNSMDYRLAVVLNESSENEHSNTFRNNIIQYGSCSIKWMGAAPSEINNRFENNSFENFNFCGCYMGNQSNVLFQNNTIRTNSSFNLTFGLQLYYSDYTQINGNSIIVPRYYGIHLLVCNGDNMHWENITNNFISVGGFGNSAGICISSSDYINIFHNTINHYGISTSYGGAIHVQTCVGTNLKNNILAGTNGAKSIYVNDPQPGFSSDYNQFYSSGSAVGYYDTLTTTLYDWQTASSQDLHSHVINPEFISITNPHIVVFGADNLGIPVGITTDIDGETRSTTTPDIGCDEYNHGLMDASLVAINPIPPCNLGLETIGIHIANNGLDTINGNLLANYSIDNGTPVSQPVTNQILPGDTVYFEFSVPADFSAPDSNRTFSNKVWVALTGDLMFANDSLDFSVLSITPTEVVAANETVPYSGYTTLNATSTDPILWFADAGLNTLLATGPSFTTPMLFDTTVYYVVSNSDTEYHYNFTWDLDGWSVLNPCNPGIYQWGWNTDGGTGAAYMIDPSIGSGSALISPVFDIDGAEISLSFRHKYMTEACCDHGYVAYRIDDENWQEFPLTSGSYTGFYDIYSNPLQASCYTTFSTPAFSGYQTSYITSSGSISTHGGSQLQIAFVFSSNSGTSGNGWYIDNVSVFKSGCYSEVFADTVFVAGAPVTDIGVIAVDEPNNGIELTQNETVKVSVKNFGSATISNIPVSFTVNGGAPATETLPGPVHPGDTATYTFTAAADLSAFGTYEIAAFTSLSGDLFPVNDTVKKQVVCSPMIYCASGATNSVYEDIGSFTVGSMNNASSTPYNETYTDYSTTVVPPCLSLGQTYPVSINIVALGGSHSGYCELYIDYNHDGTFSEPGEIAYGSAYTTQPQTLSGTIAIPLTASVGNTRMRVVVCESGSAASTVPCGTYGWGETEDYTVTLAHYIPNDAGVISIDEPYFVQSESSTVPVSITVKNFGSSALTSIPVEYVANGSAPVTYIWTGSLAPDATTQITLPDVAVLPDSNEICAYTIVVDDTNTFNDESCAWFFGLPDVIIFEDDMENGTQLFTDEPTLWEHGIPTASVINAAHSPDSVWATNLDGDYSNSAIGFIYTPGFNLFGIQGTFLTFYYWIDAEENNDGGYVQYTTNNGSTWNSLGSINTPYGFNWYDSYASGTPAWTKNTNGWRPAFIRLDAVSDNNSVNFRFGFKSNTSTVFNGFAIDDIKILGPKVSIDGGVVEIVNPSAPAAPGTQTAVRVRIKNSGTDTLTSIPISYKLDTGFPSQNDTWTGVLLPGDTTTYTFSQTYPSPATNYKLCSFTKITADPYKLNDSTCVYFAVNTSIDETLMNGVVLLQNVPNPASAQTEITFTLPAPGKCVLTLRNTLGELIQTTTIDGQSGKNSVNVDLSRLGQGIYVYTLEYKDVVLTRRLSVIK